MEAAEETHHRGASDEEWDNQPPKKVRTTMCGNCFEDDVECGRHVFLKRKTWLCTECWPGRNNV